MATERLKTLGRAAREAEVMHWVCDGKTNPEIARTMNLVSMLRTPFRQAR